MQATTIVAENDTNETIRFDVKWGDHDPFHLVPVGDPSEIEGIRQPIYKLARCKCKGDGHCMEDDQPPPRPLELEPGGTFTYQWKGTMVVWKESAKDPGDRYCEVAPVPAGIYRIFACAEDRRCASTEVRLPSRNPIVIKMSTIEPAP